MSTHSKCPFCGEQVQVLVQKVKSGTKKKPIRRQSRSQPPGRIAIEVKINGNGKV